MRLFRSCATLAVITGLMLSTPRAPWAAEPESLAQRTFDVRVEGAVVEVTFALALSEVPSYPVTITAISGPVEELLWDGVLSEGFYRLRAPLTKITAGALKVVLRTKVTNRSAQGPQSYLRYLTWEGTVR
jgi:hypothetical protein